MAAHRRMPGGHLWLATAVRSPAPIMSGDADMQNAELCFLLHPYLGERRGASHRAVKARLAAQEPQATVLAASRRHLLQTFQAKPAGHPEEAEETRHPGEGDTVTCRHR